MAAATGAVQNVGLPNIQNENSAPSVRLRNSRPAVATDVSWAASRTPIAAMLRTLRSKLQPASTDSSADPARELEPEEDRDVLLQPPPGAEAGEERTEKREGSDHSLIR